MASPPIAQSAPSVAPSVASPPMSQFTFGHPSMMPPGTVPPHYQVPSNGINQVSGGHSPHVQPTQGPQFPNAPYYPLGFFSPQHGADGQVTLPLGYPYAHGWYPVHQHYQAQAPQPTGPPQAPASAPAAPRSTPVAPQPAFGIDPALLADDVPMPVVPPTSSGHETDQPSNIAPLSTGVREPVVTPGPTPSTTGPGESPSEIIPSAGVQDESVSRATKRRRTADDENSEESQDDGEGGDTEGADTEGTPSTVTSVTKTKRLAASKSKPLYEHVIGAGMGGEIRDAEDQSDAEKIFRTRELPDPFSLQAASTRHYRRNIPEILTRIESLATRTGCLAYFAIQHFESGENFYYYISEALRDWAPADARDIHKKVGSTFSSVMAAYQAAKVELQREVEAVKSRAIVAEQKAASMQAERDKLMEERVQNLEEIERLKANSSNAQAISST